MLSVDAVLLVAALVCFVAAATGWSKGIPVGLACWVASVLL